MSRKTTAAFVTLAVVLSLFAGATASVAAQTQGDDAGEGDSILEKIEVYVEAIVGIDDAQVDAPDNQTDETQNQTDDEEQQADDGNQTDENQTDNQTDNQTEDELDVSVEGTDAERTVVVTKDGEPVEGATVVLNGQEAGTTDAQGELPLDENVSEEDLEVEVEVEIEGQIVTQHEVLGGPDQNHSVTINQSRAVEIARNEVSQDVNWSVDSARLVEGAGFYDVRMSGEDGESAKVRVDASSEAAFFVHVKMPAPTDAEPGAVNVTDYEVSNTTVAPNETVTVNATAENTGDEEATDNVTLYVDGNESETREVTVGPDSSSNVEFETAFEQTGDHTVTVNDLEPTTVTVEEANETPDDGNETPEDGNETETQSSDSVDVVLDGAPNGLQKYSVTVTVDNASIDNVEPRLVDDDSFQVVESNGSSVTFRAVDFNGDEALNGTKTLATLSLDTEVTAESVEVTVNSLTDSEGNEMDASRIAVKLGGVFDGPLPGSAADSAPTDPDGDGLYEDVNGDGQANFGDAVTLAFVDYDALDDEQTDALDFDDDGDVDFDDAIELAFEV